MGFVLAALATYYLTIAVTRTEGPWGLFYRLRRYEWLPFHCVACTALWMALAICLLQFVGEYFVVTVLAVAGLVVVIEDIRLSLLK